MKEWLETPAFLGAAMKLSFPLGVENRDTVSGKWRPFGVGIDVHKEMLWACVLCPEYAASKQHRSLCKFATDRCGLQDLHKWLNSQVPPEHRAFLIESTSTYH